MNVQPLFLRRHEKITIVAVVIMAFMASLCLPLFTYGTTLALFGLAHVVSELRYVDQRFSSRISSLFALILAVLLLSIVVGRAGIIFHLLPQPLAQSVELSLIGLMIMSVTVSVSLRHQAKARLIVAIAAAQSYTNCAFIHDILPKELRKRAWQIKSFYLFWFAAFAGFWGSFWQPNN